MKLYIASGWPFRHSVAEINKQLRANGFDIISTWIEKENGISTPESFAADALRDTTEVNSADVLLAIMMNDKYSYRGTWTEIGCSIGLKKRIIIVCPGLGTQRQISDTCYEYSYYCMNNVFFWHPAIQRVKTIDDAIELLRTYCG